MPSAIDNVAAMFLFCYTVPVVVYQNDAMQFTAFKTLPQGYQKHPPSGNLNMFSQILIEYSAHSQYVLKV